MARRATRGSVMALALAGAAGLAGAGSVRAQPAPVPSPPPVATTAAPLVGGVDFISPVGEPFHSPDALSGAEHWFRRADANGDGRLTLAELRADSLTFFKLLDVNHDGEIDGIEIDRYETQIAPEISVLSTGETVEASGDDSSPPAGPPYPDRLGAGRYGYIDLPEPIASMDLNFDRGISAHEFEQAVERRFAALDTNGDGVITRDELPKLKAADDDGGSHKHRHHGHAPLPPPP